MATKGASSGTMITICNYDNYQGFDEAEGQAAGQKIRKTNANNTQIVRKRVRKFSCNHKHIRTLFVKEKKSGTQTCTQNRRKMYANNTQNERCKHLINCRSAFKHNNNTQNALF